MTEPVDLMELLRMPREFAEQAASPIPEVRDLVDDLAAYGIAVHALIGERDRYRHNLEWIAEREAGRWAGEVARCALAGWALGGLAAPSPSSPGRQARAGDDEERVSRRRAAPQRAVRRADAGWETKT